MLTNRQASMRAAMLVVTAAFWLTATASSARAATCPNEPLRAGQQATFLPECRAYELVSPPYATLESKPIAGSLGGGATDAAQASPAGSGIAWSSYYPPGGESTGGRYFLSRRGAAGWGTEATTPPQSPGSEFFFACQPSMVFSPRLSRAVLSDGWESDGRIHEVAAYCGHNEPALVSEPEGWQSEPEGFQNLFLRDNAAGAYSLINRTPTGVTPDNAYFEAASTNAGEEFSHVVFEEKAQLTPEAPEGAENLYDAAGGIVRLVTVMPNGTPTAGQLADGVEITPSASVSAAQFTHAVSADGERVVFTANGGLYLRVNAMETQSAMTGEKCSEATKACTIQLDAPQGGAGAGGGGVFLWASADGTRIYFSDGASAGLTSDTQSGSGQNLYEYRLPAGSAEGTLTDLTPYSEAAVDGVSGASEDGLILYFVADAVLPGSGASNTGNCSVPFSTEEESEGVTHSCNLYVLHEGRFNYVTTVEKAPGGNLAQDHDWGASNAEFAALTARVSSNGRYLAFDSKQETGVTEIWRYGLGEGLACVSCAPIGSTTTQTLISRPEFSENELGPLYLNHYVLNDGAVFFTSSAALASQDGNAVADVYEYSEGVPHLISSGSSPDGSYFVDASEGGEGGIGTDVFFETTQKLVVGDPGRGVRLYDARIDGGFAEAEVARECGSSEECRSGQGSGSALTSPSSATFSGPGNPATRSAQQSADANNRGQKLARALRACKRLRSGKKRRECMHKARRRYGAHGRGTSSRIASRSAGPQQTRGTR